jgi:hypothetical protein
MRVLAGDITLGHKPRLMSIRSMAKDYDRVVTLLGNPENADQIGHLVKQAGMKWSHFPLWRVWQADPEVIGQYAKKVIYFMRDGERVYLHCSAGIHRTGYVAFMVLGGIGYTCEEAIAALCVERPKVADDYRRFLAGKHFAKSCVVPENWLACRRK